MTINCGPNQSDMQAALPTRINLSAVIGPEKFSAICKEIVTQHDGNAAHRLLDREVTNLLTSLGYGEGMAIFIKNVGSYHND